MVCILLLPVFQAKTNPATDQITKQVICKDGLFCSPFVSSILAAQGISRKKKNMQKDALNERVVTYL